MKGKGGDEGLRAYEETTKSGRSKMRGKACEVDQWPELAI